MNDPLTLLAAPRRREILLSLWEGERTAGEIAAGFDVTFSAISQHLAKLRAGGLVTRRTEGRRRIYRIRWEALGSLAPYLEAAWRRRVARLKTLVEEEAHRDEH